MKNFPTPAASFPSGVGAHVLFAVVSALVVWFYGWTVAPSKTDWGNIDARGAHYNLLVEGLLVGQLNLKVDVPPGLAALPDPYDPQANRIYRTDFHLHDASYYRGKLYIYYGITPALVLFLPYRLLTGDYLYNKQAVFVFCSMGFILGALLLRACWRRYFPNVPAVVVAAGMITLGLTSSVPLLLRTPAICEIAIACAYAFLMAMLAALWRAHHVLNSGRWLTLASVCFGLAVGARPSLLPAGIVLLLPLATARQRSQGVWRMLALLVAPSFLVGAALASYNYFRFGDVFEFGQRYQMAGDRQDTAQHFSLSYLWFNFRIYFLEGVSWGKVFPYVEQITFPPTPAGHAAPESGYGILTNTPIALFALGVGVLWSRPAPPEWMGLRLIVLSIALLFLCTATLLVFFYGTVLRYQAEFSPWLALLAALGLLAVEAITHEWPGIRRVVRIGWVSSLLFSSAFIVLTNVKQFAEELNTQGVLLAQEGKIEEAIARIASSLEIKSDFASAHSNLGLLHVSRGNPQTAIPHFTAALAREPNSAALHNDLGRALAATHKISEAAEHFNRAVQLAPRFAAAHLNLATMLLQLGQPAAAVSHYEAAINLGFQMPGLPESLELARQAARGNAPVAP